MRWFAGPPLSSVRLGIGLVLFTKAVCGAECVPARFEPVLVDITVLFSFKSTAFQMDSLYRALHPQLALGSKSVQPSSISSEQGTLHAHFCLDPKSIGLPLPTSSGDIARPTSTAVLSMGPRRLTIQLRPVTWKQVSPPAGEPVAYVGSMSSIVFDAQPDPDWAQFSYAKWARDSKGGLLLDIGVQNFGPNNAGADIEIGYDISGIGCASGPNTIAEVPVKISYQLGTITALSGDPDYAELVERKVVLHAERCLHNYLHISLGGTGALASGEIRRIRYRFGTDFVAELARTLPKDSFSPRLVSDAFVATAIGGRLYPRSVKIEGVDALQPK